MRKIAVAAAATLGLLAALPCHAQGAGGDEMKERMAALRQSMERSRLALQSYEWIETTTVSVSGQQKSFHQDLCRSGLDGVVVKTPLAASPPPKKQGGLRGAMMEKKKEEMAGTVKKAMVLLKSYVPPSQALIQRSMDAGKGSLQVIDPGRVVRLTFRDYELPGDSLSLTLDVAANRVLGVTVTTYVDTPATQVALTSAMATLPDGTSYTARTELAVPSEKLVVDVTNAGYRKL